VFNDNYKLLELDELEQKIKSEKRLPDMPTAGEVEANRINLGEMQAKLLQKIEELTLYVISLKKENDKLNSRLKRIKSVRKD
jgi:vacuolar-type H+-ATPase subunit I/STV1